MTRSPERIIAKPQQQQQQQQYRGTSPVVNNRIRRSAEHRQRSPSPQYQPRQAPNETTTSPKERFQDAKEKFRQMEREAIVARPAVAKINGRNENRPSHR